MKDKKKQSLTECVWLWLAVCVYVCVCFPLTRFNVMDYTGMITIKYSKVTSLSGFVLLFRSYSAKHKQ